MSDALHRLDSVARDFRARLDGLDDGELRRIAHAAARRAVAQTRLEERLVDGGLEAVAVDQTYIRPDTALEMTGLVPLGPDGFLASLIEDGSFAVNYFPDGSKPLFDPDDTRMKS